MIKAVVFDMDGLMFDTERLCEKAFRWAGQKLDFEISHEFFVSLLGVTRGEVERRFQEEFGHSFPMAHFWELSNDYRKTYIESYGLPEKPGLHPLLHYLSGHGYRIAVASSTDRPTVISHLNRAGIGDMFDVVVGGDMIEHSKPAPDIYLKACELLGVFPHDCIALEDSFHGIRSAYAAGLKTVMVPDLLPPAEEILPMLYAKVDRLDEIVELLERSRIHGGSKDECNADA